jgi:hypothetical protein
MSVGNGNFLVERRFRAGRVAYFNEREVQSVNARARHASHKGAQLHRDADASAAWSLKWSNSKMLVNARF